jgi:hypothetical protein
MWAMMRRQWNTIALYCQVHRRFGCARVTAMLWLMWVRHKFLPKLMLPLLPSPGVPALF